MQPSLIVFKLKTRTNIFTGFGPVYFNGSSPPYLLSNMDYSVQIKMKAYENLKPICSHSCINYFFLAISIARAMQIVFQAKLKRAHFVLHCSFLKKDE